MSEHTAESDAGAMGLLWDCGRCGTRHVLACCHASRHNKCDDCVREQHEQRAIRIQRERSQ
jgi:hypothetical protein